LQEPYRGLYGILLTSYTDRDQVHLDDLSSQADFVAATAQGIVWPVLASEFFLMSDDERAAGYPSVAAGCRKRVPFVAGVSATTTANAARLAEAAAKAGADAVICMAPYLKKATGDNLIQHFEAVAGADLPIFLQNAAYLTGACTLTPADLLVLADRIPQVRYLKEEAPVLPTTITNILKKVPGKFKGVFGGGGSRFLIDELNRGGAGNMPACEWADIFGHAFHLYERGEMAKAREIHGAALTGYNLEAAYGMDGARVVLKKRGVMKSTRTRYSSEASLDADAMSEIDSTLEFLAPYLRWPDHKLNP
jgi:dihydrodipicolinate synthase/N-acetylneuraminate lyase